MEIFVNKLLETADLTLLTKKLVREKYCEEIGRDLTLEEKHGVNSLVQDFVNKLAEEQRSSPDKVEVSPGNKENTVENVSPKKGKSAKVQNSAPLSPRLTPQKGQSTTEKTVWTSPRRSSPGKKNISPLKKVSPRKKRVISPRLKVEEVLSAVLESDGEAMSEELSEDSSSEDQESEGTKELKAVEVRKGLELLKVARDKKIQMSQEKKQKFRRVHIKDRETEKDGNSSDSVMLISDTDKETDRNSVQTTPVKSVGQNPDIITISSVSDSSPVTLNKTPESYLGDKLTLKKQAKTPVEKGVGNKISPKTRKRKAAMIADSEDEVVVRISKRRKHRVSRSRLDVSDSQESETNDFSDSTDGDREARNLKTSNIPKVKKGIYSFDSKSSSTDFEIKTFRSRKRKVSRGSTSRSTSLCSTPVKSENETLVQSPSSSESGDTPVKTPRKRRKSHESLVKSRLKKKVSNATDEGHSNSEQDSDTGQSPGRLETSKTKKLGKKKIETKKEREHSETNESDTPVESEDETLSNLRQNISKKSENLKQKRVVVKTDSSGGSDTDEENLKRPNKLSKNAKGTKSRKDSFTETKSRKISVQNSSDNSSDSEMSEDDDLDKVSFSKSRKKVGSLTNDDESDSGLDSDNSEDIPLAKLNTSCDRQKTKVKTAIETKTSKDKNKLKGTQSKTLKKKSKPSGSEPPRVKNLRKIVRACGIVEWNDHVLKDCRTDKQKIERLKQMLKEAGMNGRPSLKKAENIKLKREAAELDSQNIISTESSRGKRKVNSRYPKRKATPSPKKQLPRTPVKKQFSGLMGIIDSEGSD